MVRNNMLAFCLASIFVLNFVNCDVENGVSSKIRSVDFVAVEDIDQFLLKNPDAQMLEKVSEIPITKNQIIYRLGSLSVGDRLVGKTSKEHKWPTLVNVKFDFDYSPPFGYRDNVTYVQVIVDQSSDVGRAYVVSGGIGQQEISVCVEAQRTLKFGYNFSVYGH